MTKPAGTPTKKPLVSPSGEDIAAHMYLVTNVVRGFVRRLPRSVQQDDLVSAGTLGLLLALRTSGGNIDACPDMFAAYARMRIRGAIVDELRRQDWSPRRHKQAVANPPAARAKNPEHDDVAPKSNVIPFPRPAEKRSDSTPPAETCEVRVVGFDDLPPTVTLCVAEASPFAQYAKHADTARLHEAIAFLPEREAWIIRMRYFEGIPSKVIAEKLGVSESRVAQLHTRATSQLKDILVARGMTGASFDLAA
jgi:RNA polymerase sigma factor for flagellar operon FliA